MGEQGPDKPLASARLVFDDSYYDLFYKEFLARRTWYRRYAIPISFLMIIAGFIILGWLSWNPIAWLFIGIGVFDLIETITHRWRWMRHAKRLQEVGEVLLEFTTSGVNKPAGRSRGQLDYECFDRFIETPNGFFLRMMKGFSTFVPKASVNPQPATAALCDLLRASIPNR